MPCADIEINLVIKDLRKNKRLFIKPWQEATETDYFKTRTQYSNIFNDKVDMKYVSLFEEVFAESFSKVLTDKSEYKEILVDEYFYLPKSALTFAQNSIEYFKELNGK